MMMMTMAACLLVGCGRPDRLSNVRVPAAGWCAPRRSPFPHPFWVRGAGRAPRRPNFARARRAAPTTQGGSVSLSVQRSAARSEVTPARARGRAAVRGRAGATRRGGVRRGPVRARASRRPGSSQRRATHIPRPHPPLQRQRRPPPRLPHLAPRRRAVRLTHLPLPNVGSLFFFFVRRCVGAPPRARARGRPPRVATLTSRAARAKQAGGGRQGG